MRIKLLFLVTLLQTTFFFAQQVPNNQGTQPVIDESQVLKEFIESSKKKGIKFANRAGDVPFTERTEMKLRGDMTFIGNNILNRATGNVAGGNTNYAYNNNHYNGWSYMDYIDVDSDNTTFSSSSSELGLPNCSKVVYAGLYWTAVYPYKSFSNRTTRDRDSDFNEIKFKLPGQPSYQDITADQIIYDNGVAGFDEPYVCYKNVTSMVQGLANPNGTYYAANIKGTIGRDRLRGLGGAAGWTMIVIYENTNSTVKNFSIFDGFTTVTNSVDETITYSGFTTVPSGAVKADVLVAALEGDKGITRDDFQIQNRFGNFISQTTGSLNPLRNFFNSSLTINNSYLSGRTPASQNTMGFDVDMYKLSNPGNSIIGNSQTSLTTRFTTGGDVYYPFINALAIEIIAPEIQMVKTIDTGGAAAGTNNLAGQTVNLGNEIYYNITFRNKGTDDATGTVFVDRLPKNVTFEDITLPTGLNPSDYDYTPPSVANGHRGKIEIRVPDDMVEENGAEYIIRIKVKVVENCNELVDVCSNRIENTFYGSYKGLTGGVEVNDSPSFSGINACNIGSNDPSLFLANVDNCAFERDEQMCGNEITLTAGSGFATYQWFKYGTDGTTEIPLTKCDGTLVGNVASVTLKNCGSFVPAGKYIVKKEADAASGCIKLQEVITVLDDTTVRPNPLLNLSPSHDAVETCSNGGSEMVYFFLCGSTAERTITLPYASTNHTVTWEKLQNPPTNDTEENCPKTASNWNWSNINAGGLTKSKEFSKTFTDKGYYRVTVWYDDKCPVTYYFRMTKETLATPSIDAPAILCDKPVTVTVTNIPVGYEYKVESHTSNPNTYSDGFKDANTFNIAKPGRYILQIRSKDNVDRRCTFEHEFEIRKESLDVALSLQGANNILCADSDVEIIVRENGIGTLDTNDYYTYKVYDKDNDLVGEINNTQDKDVSFTVTNNGDFTVVVSTTSGCTQSKVIPVTKPEELKLTATKQRDISCKNGLIQLTATGGTLDTVLGDVYKFALISKDGVAIPQSSWVYFTDTDYEVTDAGKYIFKVFDSNNCKADSKEVTVKKEAPLEFEYTTIPPDCPGGKGSIEVTLKAGSTLNGNSLEYSIDDFATSNTNGIFTGLDVSPQQYTVKVKATKGATECIYEKEVEIADREEMVVSNAVRNNHLACNTDGKITFSAVTSGGVAPYTYGYKLSTDTNYTYSTDLIKNIGVAGTYNIRVKDSKGCTIDLDDITINDKPVLPNFNSEVTYDCKGIGTITVTPDTTPPTVPLPSSGVEYSLNGGAKQTSNVFTLPSAVSASTTYNVTISLADACDKTVSALVEANKEFSAKYDSHKNPTCHGSTNGSITISSVNFGTEFEYKLSTGTWVSSSSSPVEITGLGAGSHTIQVRPKGSTVSACVKEITRSLTQPDALEIVSIETLPANNCDDSPGSRSIKIKTTGGSGAYEYSVDGGGSWVSGTTISGTTTITGLTKGDDQTILVRDVADTTCEASKLHTIEELEPVVFTATITQCYEESATEPKNGELKVTVTDGNGGYKFMLLNDEHGNSGWESPSDPTKPDEHVFKVAPSTMDYYVRVIDSNGCESDPSLPGYELNEEFKAEIDGDIQITGCSGGKYQGKVVIKFSGGREIPTLAVVPAGSPPPSDGAYISADYASTYTLEFDSLGAHDFYLRDNNIGVSPYCEVKITNIPVAKDLPEVTVTPTHPKCSTDKGKITVTIDKGIKPYKIVVAGPTSSTVTNVTANSYEFGALDSGAYTITVTDASSSCLGSSSVTATTTINTLTAISATASVTKHVQCGSQVADRGEITFTQATGGTPDTGTPPVYYYGYKKSTESTYTYSTDLIKTNLSAGTYNLKVKDKEGCEVDLTSVVIEDKPVLPTFTATVTYDCEGKGIITVTPAGTPTPTLPSGVTYSLNGGTTQTSNEFNLPSTLTTATTYKVTVSLDRACDEEVSVIVRPNDGFTATFNRDLQPTCNGGTDGKIWIDVSGFDTGYTATGYQWRKTSADPWSATITDATLEVTGLAQGAYSIELRPVYSTGTVPTACTKTVTGTLSQPDAVVADFEFTKQITCTPNTGASIRASATGGSNTGFEYELRESDGTTVVTSWQSSPVFTNLTAPTTATTYKLYAKDSKDCKSLAKDVVVEPIKPLNNTNVAITAIKCYDPTANGGQGNGSITITITGGNGGYQFRLDGGLWQTPTPVTANTYTFNTLSPKSYQVEVKDGRNCDYTQTVPLQPQLTATVTPKDASCNPGTITITDVLGGNGNNVYAFVEAGGTPTFTSSATFSVNSSSIAGTSQLYDVYVRDQNGGTGYCEYKETVTINKIEDPEIKTITPSEPMCFGSKGSIEVVIEKGLEPYTVELFAGTTATGTPIQTQNNIIKPTTGDATVTFTDLDKGNYAVKITDKNGCEVSNTTPTEIVELPELPAVTLEKILPTACVGFVGNENEFGYKYVLPPTFTTLPTGYELQIKYYIPASGSYAWRTVTSGTDLEVRGIQPLTVVDTGIRIRKTTPPPVSVVCEEDLGKFRVPLEVSTLLIDATYDLGTCSNGLSVTLRATEGSGNYSFAINEIPATSAGWDPQTSTYTDPVTGEVEGRITYDNLIPGRSYKFYVIDNVSHCIKENDKTASIDTAIAPAPTIIGTPTHACDATGTGSIDFVINTKGVITDGVAVWKLYDVANNTTPVATGTVSGIVGNTATIPPVSVPTNKKYYLVIEEGTGPAMCKYGSKDIEVKPGTPITADLNVKQTITCSKDGEITVDNVRGGFGGYQYLSSNLVVTHNGSTISNPAITVAGNKITLPHSAFSATDIATDNTVNIAFKIVDSNGCEVTKNTTINIAQKPVITSATPTTCGADKTIAVQLNATIGKAPYRYSKDNGSTYTAPTNSTLYTFNNLSPTDEFTATMYPIKVIDANDCESDPVEARIYPSLDFNVKQSREITCDATNPESEIEIEFLSGQLGTYNYEIVYSGTVTPAPTNINGTVAPTASTKKFTLPVTTTSGEYAITLTPNMAAPHSVYNTCKKRKTFTINERKELVAKVNYLKNNGCDGSNSGSIEILPDTGNEVPFTSYTISGATLPGSYITTNTSGKFTGLPEGTYNVEVTGTNTCTTTVAVTITELDPLVIPLLPAVQFACPPATPLNPNNAKIEVGTITGGKQNATGSTAIDRIEFYTKANVTDPDPTTPIQSGLSQVLNISDTTNGDGVYYAIVYDKAGCSQRSANQTINKYNKLVKGIVTFNPATDRLTCTNGERIVVTYESSPTSSITSATFEIYKGGTTYTAPTTPSITPTSATYYLEEGFYTIKITNPLTGCKVEVTHEVKPLPEYTLDVSVVSNACYGTGDTSGSARIKFNTASNYTNNYSYQLYSGTPPSGTAVGSLVTGQTGEVTINNLGAGDYYVIATMESTPQCESKPAIFKIDAPTNPIDITATLVKPSCVGDADGKIALTATGGWGAHTFRLYRNSVAPANEITTNIVNGNTFTNLVATSTASPITYIAEATDANGCKTIKSITLNNPDPIVISSVVENDNSCSTTVNNGSLTVTASGGTGSLTYVLVGVDATATPPTNDLRTQNTGAFTGLSAGTYRVRVVDSKGCNITTTNDYTITPAFRATVAEVEELDCDTPSPNDEALVKITVTSGSGKYAYQVTTSTTATIIPKTTFVGSGTSGAATATFRMATAGVYNVRVYDQAEILTGSPATLTTNECSVLKQVTISPKKQVIAKAIIGESGCHGAKTGSVQIVPDTGNQVNFKQYEIFLRDPGTGVLSPVVSYTHPSTNTTGLFKDLPEQTYTVVVTGTNNCTTNVDIAIVDLKEIVPDIATPIQFVCSTTNPLNSGSARLEIIKAEGGRLKPTSTTETDIQRIEFYKRGTPDVLVQRGASKTFETSDTVNGHGTYYAIVYDTKGCSGQSADMVINPFNKLDKGTVTLNDRLTCSVDESITVNYTSLPAGSIEGSTNKATYEITKAGGGFSQTDTGVGASGVTYSNLKEGFYTITITNPDTGCSIQVTHEVEPLPKFELSLTPVTDACFGAGDTGGSVKFKFKNTPPYSITGYSYQLYNQPYAAGNTPIRSEVGLTGETTVTGLAQGNYYIIATMTTIPNCPSERLEFSIKAPAKQLEITAEEKLISCLSNNSGAVTLSAEGGWGFYTYKLENLTTGTTVQDFDANTLIAGLTPGDYMATVKDLNGCINTKAFTLKDPADDPIVGTYTIVDEILCNGDATATVKIDATGGQGNPVKYVYTLVYLDKGNITETQDEPEFKNLPKGKYEVIISDEYSCKNNTPITFEITEPTKVIAKAKILSSVTCTKDKAVVKLSAEEGTFGATGYLFSDKEDGSYSATDEFEVLPGKHTFYVKDENGCKAKVTIPIAGVEKLEAKLDTSGAFLTCNSDDNAVLKAIVKGGVGKYQYSLLDKDKNVIAGPQDQDFFTGLSIGTYSIRVTSDADCTDDTEPFTIKDVPPLTLTVEPVHVKCPGDATGKLLVTAEGGNGKEYGDYVFNISSDDPKKYITVKEFTQLKAGIYTVRAKDSKGCMAEPVDIEITEPAPLEVLETDVIVTQQVCITDPVPTLEITKIKGGTKPYFLIINGKEHPYTVGDKFTLEHNKLYNIVVTDSNKCEFNVEFERKTDKAVDLKLDVTDVAYSCSDIATVKATVGKEYENNVEYSLLDNDNDFNEVAKNESGVFSGMEAGDYVIKVAHKTKGCPIYSESFNVREIEKPLQFTVDHSQKNKLIINAEGGLAPYSYSIDGKEFTTDDTFTIYETRDYEIRIMDERGEQCIVGKVVRGEYITIEIPNAFTPDGDGKNDYWYPNEVEEYHNAVIYIYDRYNRKLKTFKGVSREGWDGTYNGNPLPTGDYWYTIFYNELSGEEKKLIGHFTLLRNYRK